MPSPVSKIWSYQKNYQKNPRKNLDVHSHLRGSSVQDNRLPPHAERVLYTTYIMGCPPSAPPADFTCLIRSTGTNYHVIASVASAHVRPIRRQSEVNSTSNDSTNQGTNTVQSIHPQDAVADNGIPPCPWSICKGRVPLPWP